uniref:Proteasome 26S subunit, non-ATPase 7 n=1 Tax=Chrysolophus pictus TaxID=9089 RepID=A0A8C3M3I6_CHRPC
MYGMFKKVNARERIVGWYHTGPKLHKNDIAINELMKRYCPNSVLVIIDVKPKDLGLPTEAYISVEEVHDDGTPTSKTFEHVTSEIGAEEAEEVGVEHLLRDIKDTTVGTLSQRITNQDVFNLLPDVNLQEFVKAFYLKTNDQMVVVYLASLIRSVVALHNLINNKIANRDAEKRSQCQITAEPQREPPPLPPPSTGPGEWAAVPVARALRAHRRCLLLPPSPRLSPGTGIFG